MAEAVPSRQQRRARLRQLRHAGEAVVAEGLPAKNAIEPTVALARILIDTLTSNAPDRARAAADIAQRTMDRSLERHPGPAVACRKGCSHCCSNFIAASIPEVLAVAAAVGEFAPESGDALATRLASANADGRDWSGGQRQTISQPCPLLVDHACSVYRSRPLGCRGYASTSVDICVQALTEDSVTIPTPNSFVFFRTRTTTALWAALKAVDLPNASYDLNAALTVAMANREAERQWLAGSDPFAGVRTDRSRSADVEPFLDRLIAGAT